MKEMKKVIINTVWILSLGLLASCADIINGSPSVLPETSAGKGRVVVTIGPRLDGARTFMPTEPEVGYYANLSYTLEFTAKDRAPVSGSITGGTGSVELEAGTWDLKVSGKDTDDTEVLEGRVTGIVITAGATTNVPVTLAAFTEDGTGTLSYSVDFPLGVIKGTLTIYNWDGEIAEETVDLLPIANGDTELPAGYYRIALDLYKASGVFHRTDIAHIYPGLITETAYATVVDGDFVGAVVDSGETSLAAVLAGIGGLSSGADKLYLLPAGDETISATSTVSNTSGPVTVTIDGGGREVTLSGTGALITVGNNVTLIVRNITLRGRGIESGDPVNNAALVAVQSGGTLELRTGAHITANKRSSNGGGVYVYANGTFVMSGGEISGNDISTSTGGGVFVAGTFAMSGGKISGNTAGDGGGVTAWSDGFTMSGGEISGNTAYFGGGVRVVAAKTFTMSGGKISGNRAYNDGGGVYINDSGSLILNGGEISGNRAPFGGGVLVNENVTLAMNGGKISGNTASSQGGGAYISGSIGNPGATFTLGDGEISGNTAIDGGGVYIGYNSVFTMSGGKILGNTAFGDRDYFYGGVGGGVLVSDSATSFTMSGGEISDNTASSYGDGVYVDYSGIFTMSGGARINVNNAVCLYYSSSSGPFVTIGGDFTGAGGPVAQIDFESSGYPSALSGLAVLKLASGYSGNLASLKNRFTLGIFTYSTGVNGTVGPVSTAGYEIGNDGTLQTASPSSPTPSTGIMNISYSAVSGGAWTLLGDGRRQSPAIDHKDETKSRINFTTTQANASITIQLDVSSEVYDWAFVSALDNASATYVKGYYPRSIISGTNSVTVTIPVPTAGSHFVDVCYQKDDSVNKDSDCAWYKVVF